VTVKDHQGKLYAQCQPQRHMASPHSEVVETETAHGRHLTRCGWVYTEVEALRSTWSGIERLIWLERFGQRSGKSYSDCCFDISSLALDAAQFAHGIRHHWSIENRLHGVKDVVLREDDAPYHDYPTATNGALLRTFVVSLLRRHGFDSRRDDCWLSGAVVYC